MQCIPRMPVLLRVMCRMGLEVPWLLEHEERPSGFDVLKALIQSKEFLESILGTKSTLHFLTQICVIPKHYSVFYEHEAMNPIFGFEF